MIATPHIFFGAALGNVIGNPYLTAIIAFITHYLLDAIPHYQPKPVKGFKEGNLRGMDKKDWILKSIEPTLGITAVCGFMFTDSNPLPLVIGAFFGFLPDFLWFLEWKYGIRTLPFPIPQWEHKFHKHVSFIRGIVPQVIVTILAILYLI